MQNWKSFFSVVFYINLINMIKSTVFVHIYMYIFVNRTAVHRTAVLCRYEKTRWLFCVCIPYCQNRMAILCWHEGTSRWIVLVWGIQAAVLCLYQVTRQWLSVSMREPDGCSVFVSGNQEESQPQFCEFYEKNTWLFGLV